MNLSNLIERIRKEHVHIQEERRSIQQLNNDVCRFLNQDYCY